MSNSARDLRIFACDCAERALRRWHECGREPPSAFWNAIRVARLFAKGLATPRALKKARKEVDRTIKQTVREESDRIHQLPFEQIASQTREDFSWYGAVNAVYAACHRVPEKAAEFAAREARREARRMKQEVREIEWQKMRLCQLNLSHD